MQHLWAMTTGLLKANHLADQTAVMTVARWVVQMAQYWAAQRADRRALHLVDRSADHWAATKAGQ